MSSTSPFAPQSPAREPSMPPFLGRIWPVQAAFDILHPVGVCFLTKRPHLSLSIFLFYEFCILTIAFIGKVWENSKIGCKNVAVLR